VRVSKLLLTAFALGLASLDVTGTLLATGAMGSGARNRVLVVFGCVSILGTLAFGAALSLIVGPRIAGIDWEALLPRDPTEDRIAAYLEVVIGAGLLAWGMVRVWRPTTGPPKPSAPRGLGIISMTGVGVLFALSGILSPPFVSLVVIAGRAEHFWSVMAAHWTYALVSHTPLILLLVFALTSNHERVVRWFQGSWARIRPLAFRLVTGVVLIVGALFLLDAAWWHFTGDFLVPD
jgi:cytochrome c biogenesis protein CcdA